MVVPIHGTIDEGMAHLVGRAVAEAKAANARAIVLDVNTFGGLVSAATEIRDALLDSPVPVDAYVTRAWSAGALVSLSPRRASRWPRRLDRRRRADPQDGQDGLGAARRVRRDRRALPSQRAPGRAMVDTNVDAPAYKAPGGILTLTAEQARTAGILRGDRAVARRGAGALRPRRRAAHAARATRFAEQLARFATNPEVSGILLAIGFLGLLVELQTLHGLAGAVGATSLALFFGTHVYAGFSNGLVVALALLGILLILFELHVLPGHGFAGTLGVLILVASVLLAFGLPFFVGALQSLAVAIVLSALAFALLQRVLPENAFVKRLMFAGHARPGLRRRAPTTAHLLGAQRHRASVPAPGRRRDVRRHPRRRADGGRVRPGRNTRPRHPRRRRAHLRAPRSVMD